MEKESIERNILAAADKYARFKKVRFGDGANNDIHRFASVAADQIVQTAPDQHSGRVKAASLSFELLVDEMIRQSERIPGYSIRNPGVIGEETLHKALSILCPLWPFC